MSALAANRIMRALGRTGRCGAVCLVALALAGSGYAQSAKKSTTPKPEKQKAVTKATPAPKTRPKTEQEVIAEREAAMLLDRQIKQKKEEALQREAAAAMDVLRTSLNRQERATAFGNLTRPQQPLPGEWANELGRYIVGGGWHAEAAVMPLAATGMEGMPVIVELLRDPAMQTQMHATFALDRMRGNYGSSLFSEKRKWDGEAMLKAVRPLVDDPQPHIRFGAILALRKLVAEPPVELLQDKVEILRLGAAVMLGRRREVQPEVLRAMAASKSPTQRFMAEWVAEMERGRRAFPGGVPHNLVFPAEEYAKRDEAKRKLRIRALEAWPECQRLMQEAREPYERFCVFEIITTISPFLEAEQPQIIEAVRPWAEKGGWLERKMRHWMNAEPRVRNEWTSW
jgi:hypothetical protein